jgi:hypothetical protein
MSDTVLAGVPAKPLFYHETTMWGTLKTLKNGESGVSCSALTVKIC